MKKLTVSQNALYNTIGTVAFCFCQWIISALLVVHLSPKEMSVSNAGILQLAISVTNIFFSISTYNIRTYQISDTQNKFSYGDYVGTRFVTAAIAVVLCVAYALFCGYSTKILWCIIFYMVFKLNETFSDVLHGVDQKLYRMDYVGISLTVRGILMAAVFGIVLKFTGDLLLAIVAMTFVTFAVVILYDIKVTSALGSIKPIFNKEKIIKLLVICLPAVVALASFTAITSVPRQMLEKTLGEEALGYYGTIATPLMVVQVMATSVFNPMLTQLAEDYNNGEVKQIFKKLLKNFLILICITGFVLMCVLLFGKFAVGLVFGREYVEYTYLMYGIMGCTTMYVISWLCINVLIVIRKLMVGMIASVLALAFSTLTSKLFINLFGMNGVSANIILAYFLQSLICLIVIVKNLKARGKSFELLN